MLGTIIDVDALWQTVWTAAVAGVGVSVVFSVAVLGGTRSLERRREERSGSAAAYGVVALLGVAGTLAAVVFGVLLITTK